MTLFFTVFIASCRLRLGCQLDTHIIVAGTDGAVAAVVAVSTDEIAVVAVGAVALVARCRRLQWPRVGHAGTERYQGGTDENERHGQQTTERRTHVFSTKYRPKPQCSQSDLANSSSGQRTLTR